MFKDMFDLIDKLLDKARGIITALNVRITQVKHMDNEGAFTRMREGTSNMGSMFIIIAIITIVVLIYYYIKVKQDNGLAKRPKKLEYLENFIINKYSYKPAYSIQTETLFNVEDLNWELREDEMYSRLFIDELYYCESGEWKKYKGKYYVIREKLEEILKEEDRNDVILLETSEGCQSYLSEGTYVLKEEYDDVPKLDKMYLLKHGVMV